MSLAARIPSRSTLRPNLALPASLHLDSLVFFGLAGVVAYLFRDALFAGRVLFLRDINMVWLPQVEALLRTVAQGSWPLWDPYTGFGRPLLADPRAEVLYPFTWLNLLLSPGKFYTAFTVCHLLFSGTGLALLARRWGASRPAAFIAGSTWIASGPFLSLVSMWHHLAAAAWIPWIFLALDIALDSGRMGNIVWAGAVLAAQILAGSPDMTALTLLAAAAYVALRRPVWRRAPRSSAKRPLGSALLALILGLGFAAAQWLPTLNWALRSERSSFTYAEATIWSLHPGALPEIALPFRWVQLPLRPELIQNVLDSREPWLHSIYLGSVGLALAVVGVVRGGPRRHFLAGLVLVALVFALGRHTPLHGMLVGLMPPLGMLRYPVKAMILAALGWSVLAGMGLDAWHRDWQTRRPPPWLLGLIAGLIVASVAGVLLTTRLADSVGAHLLRSQPHQTHAAALAPAGLDLGLSTAVCAALLTLALLRPRWPGVRTGLLLLTVTPLVVAHHDLHPTAPRELLDARPPALDIIKQNPLPRVYVYDYSILTADQRKNRSADPSSYRLARVPRGWKPAAARVLGTHLYLNPPTAARWGLPGSYDQDILGFAAPPQKRLVEFLREVENTPAHLRLLQMGAVTHVLALTPAEWWQDLLPVAQEDTLFTQPASIFAVPTPLPRCSVVSGIRVADVEGTLRLIQDAGFDPRREIVTTGGVPVPAQSEAPGSARVIAARPDRIRIQAHMREAGYIVLRDAYDPGWSARVDGVDTPVIQADLLFRAVRVSAGQHVIEFLYLPGSVVTGAGLSAATVLLALLWTGTLRRTSR